MKTMVANSNSNKNQSMLVVLITYDEIFYYAAKLRTSMSLHIDIFPFASRLLYINLFETRNVISRSMSVLFGNQEVKREYTLIAYEYIEHFNFTSFTTLTN